MLLGTWNLENLYRPGGPFGPKDKAAYETKLAALADGIRALGPGLLGVQEVGDPEALADLVETVGGAWHLALSAHADSRGIRVGVISRTPLEILADTHSFPARLRPVQVDDSGTTVAASGRGFLAVETVTESGPLRVAVAHLKSKLLSYPGGRFFPRDEGERARYGAYALHRRGAEATALRALADDLLADGGRERDVAVLGDLNDEVQAATTQVLLGPPGSEIGTSGFEAPDRGDGARLWNVAPLIPADRRYSRINSGRRELIDHILTSHRLVHRVTAAGTGTGTKAGAEAGTEATTGVETGAGTGAGAGAEAAAEPRLPSVGADPTARRGEPGSDHAPVWVRIG